MSYIKFSVLIGVLFFSLLSNKVQAADYYGAIYINQVTGIAGTAVDYRSINAANSAALQDCRSKNRNSEQGTCVRVVGAVNSCAATAWSPKKKKARGWWATELSVARNKSLYACRTKEFDGECAVVAGFCTSIETVVWY